MQRICNVYGPAGWLQVVGWAVGCFIEYPLLLVEKILSLLFLLLCFSERLQDIVVEEVGLQVPPRQHTNTILL